MTDTTDIAVLYATAMRAKETGTSFVIPAETAISMLKHIGVLRDNLEAERQRADANEGYFKEMEKYADKLEKAGLQIEAELAALKGEQVPVATIHRLVNHRTGQEHPWICTLGDIKDSEGDIFRVEVKPLFTAPQKPVVPVPVGFLFVVKATGAVIYSIAASDIDGAQLVGPIYGDLAIKAAGGIVKDGE